MCRTPGIPLLKRWYKWLDEYCFLKQKTVAVHEPSVLVVGTFLSSAGKGATAGQSMAKDMLWWHGRVGIQFPIKDKSITAFFKVGPGHTAKSGHAQPITAYSTGACTLLTTCWILSASLLRCGAAHNSVYPLCTQHPIHHHISDRSMDLCNCHTGKRLVQGVR